MRGWLFIPLLLCACAGERPRPDPFGVGDDAELEAQVLAPANNATVIGARPLTIEIAARDLQRDGLTGLGFVTRRGGIRQDSVVIQFPARTDSTHTFTYLVPDLPTNTQLDIYGLAFGNGEAQVSVPTMTIIVRCQPQFPACQQ